MTRIGLVPSGGDSPGTNALLRALVLRGIRGHSDEFVGFFGGWSGVREAETIELDERAVSDVSRLGGTMLGISSSTLPVIEDIPMIQAMLRLLEIDALIVVGGNGTLQAAAILHEHGVPVVGVPKSVENDIGLVHDSLGFSTAVEVATEGIDRLRATGDAHHRCTFAEVIGERAGWVALHAGVATDAHVVLVPEFPQCIEQIAEWIRAPLRRGRSPLIIVAEGFRLAEVAAQSNGEDEWGTTPQLARLLGAHTGIQTSVATLGGMQRGAAPIAADRVLAARLGFAAIDALHGQQWGRVIVTREGETTTRALAEVGGSQRLVSAGQYADHSAAFG